MTRKRFSACWGNSPIPIERCLRHRAAHPFRMLQRQFLPKKKSPVQHEHYTHTAPDIPSSTALSIFFFLPNFLLMQLLYFLLILFQDFLHDLLRHKPILHFRFGLAVLCMCSSVNGKIGLHGLNKCVSPSFLSQHHSIPVVFENVYVLF